MATATIERHVTGELSLRAGDSKNRIMPGILATGSAVHVWSEREYRAILESLVVSGCEAPDTVPLCTDHNHTIPATIGSIRAIRVDGDKLVGDVHFSAGSEIADHAWNLADARHLRGLSVGYAILQSTIVPAGKSQTIGGRLYTAPPDENLRVVTRWRLREVSLVPLPADEGAMIRAAGQTIPLSERKNTMQSLSQIIPGRDLASMPLAQYAKAILQQRDGLYAALPENDGDMFRAAFSSFGGLAVLEGVVNTAVLGGFRDGPDSTAGWIRRVGLPNYLRSQLAFPETAPRLEHVPRGATAPSVNFSMTAEGWRLARFGAQFTIDEQDAMDGKNVGVFQVALEEMGRACRRLAVDMVYATILGNAVLADGVALFDASRANLGTAALGDTALDAAMAAVANQVASDEEGGPVHTGLAARYLLVPPALFGPAKRLARDMQTGQGDLIVRAESRLGVAGVVDPRTGETATGSTTNWFLAAPSDQAAGVVVGFLDFRPEPLVRSSELTRDGQWGVAFDIQFSVAVCAVSGKPLYFSSGAGA